MTRHENPPRPVAVWAATVPVILPCAWFLCGCLMRIVQAMLGFSDVWYERLWMLGPIDLFLAPVLGAYALGFIVLQVLTVRTRSWLGAALIGVHYIMPAGIVLLVMLDARDPRSSGVDWETVLIVGGAAVLLAAGLVMLWWAWRLHRESISPLPAPPAPAEDD